MARAFSRTKVPSTGSCADGYQSVMISDRSRRRVAPARPRGPASVVAGGRVGHCDHDVLAPDGDEIGLVRLVRGFQGLDDRVGDGDEVALGGVEEVGQTLAVAAR